MRSLPQVSTLVLLAAFAMGVSDCESPSWQLAPESYESTVGVTTGTVDQIRALDAEDPGIMTLEPGSNGYQGIASFEVPEGWSIEGTEFVVYVNGPGLADFRWRFQIFDFDERLWEVIGDNAEALSGQWSRLALPVPADADRFVGANGELWLRALGDPSNDPVADRMEVDFIGLSGSSDSEAPPPVDPPPVDPPPVDPPPVDPPPPVAADRALRNYLILGNGWSASNGSSSELAHVTEHFDVIQDFRVDSGRALVASGVGTVLKYRLGGGAWPDSSNPITQEVFARVSGNAPGYPTDIRMPRAGGGVMVHDRFDYQLVDLVTPAHRPIFRAILRDSLTEFLTGPGAFQGVFVDAAGPHVPGSFSGQTPAPAGGYSREAELQGWIEVFDGLSEDFPDTTFVLNGHLPWESRDPVDFTGLGLAEGAGVGLMSESRMLTFGTVSGWADETVYDIRAMIDAGLPVNVTQSFERSSPSLAAQRFWGLATYLVASGASPLASYGMDGVVNSSQLPDFPEMDFEGLGAPVGGIVSLAEGKILEQRFELGRVVAHVKVGSSAATYTVPADMESLSLVGGGPYPANGALQWTPIAAGPMTLAAPAHPMPAGTGLILRDRP